MNQRLIFIATNHRKYQYVYAKEFSMKFFFPSKMVMLRLIEIIPCLKELHCQGACNLIPQLICTQNSLFGQSSLP